MQTVAPIAADVAVPFTPARRFAPALMATEDRKVCAIYTPAGGMRTKGDTSPPPRAALQDSVREPRRLRPLTRGAALCSDGGREVCSVYDKGSTGALWREHLRTRGMGPRVAPVKLWQRCL